MLYKSLVLGVLFSIGVFAVKSGIGLSYVMMRSTGGRSKAWTLLLFVTVYGLVFALAGFLMEHIDPVGHLRKIQTFLQSAMVVHIGLALLMTAWGVLLLRMRNHFSSPSRAWLLLVLPCPVCATVIMFTTSFGVSLFPEHSREVTAGLYAAFILMSLLTMASAYPYSRHAGISAEVFLGWAMILMAVFLISSVSVAPQFAELNRVYSLAARKAMPQQETGGLALLVTVAAAAFVAGWGITIRKIRRS